MEINTTTKMATKFVPRAHKRVYTHKKKVQPVRRYKKKNYSRFSRTTHRAHAHTRRITVYGSTAHAVKDEKTGKVDPERIFKMHVPLDGHVYYNAWSPTFRGISGTNDGYVHNNRNSDEIFASSVKDVISYRAGVPATLTHRRLVFWAKADAAFAGSYSDAGKEYRNITCRPVGDGNLSAILHGHPNLTVNEDISLTAGLAAGVTTVQNRVFSIRGANAICEVRKHYHPLKTRVKYDPGDLTGATASSQSEGPGHLFVLDIFCGTAVGHEAVITYTSDFYWAE